MTEIWDTIYNYYAASPYERVFLTLAVADIVAMKTPWKGDDDLIKMFGDILKTLVSRGRSGDKHES